MHAEANKIKHDNIQPSTRRQISTDLNEHARDNFHVIILNETTR